MKVALVVMWSLVMACLWIFAVASFAVEEDNPWWATAFIALAAGAFIGFWAVLVDSMILNSSW